MHTSLLCIIHLFPMLRIYRNWPHIISLVDIPNEIVVFMTTLKVRQNLCSSYHKMVLSYRNPITMFPVIALTSNNAV